MARPPRGADRPQDKPRGAPPPVRPALAVGGDRPLHRAAAGLGGRPRVAASMLRCPWVSGRGTSSSRKDWSGSEQVYPGASQATSRSARNSRTWRRGRGGRLATTTCRRSPSIATAYLRWYPVARQKASRIAPRSAFPPVTDGARMRASRPELLTGGLRPRRCARKRGGRPRCGRRTAKRCPDDRAPHDDRRDCRHQPIRIPARGPHVRFRPRQLDSEIWPDA